MKRLLILENGEVFVGKGFGSHVESTGEVVFNTAMTGYQEALSDPSYCGQIVTMTYPLIGNVGINRDDFESIIPNFQGLIVKELAQYPSHFRSKQSLDELLKQENIPGLSGIDTRKLTRMIGNKGTLKGRICDGNVDVDKVVQELVSLTLPTDQVARVSTKNRFLNPGANERIVLIDFGVKKGILKSIVENRYEVIVVPYNTSLGEIKSLQPDGLVLSNGPGDPRKVPEVIETVRALIGQYPILAIGLGFQIFALACGAKVEKMKHGHRGSNYPVRDLFSGTVAITSQNHGFTVLTDSIAATDLEVTHVNINDHTIEGLRHKEKAAFGVQFHLEASPGPHDTMKLFKKFENMLTNSGEEYTHA